jgi:hypothetical protein
MWPKIKLGAQVFNGCNIEIRGKNHKEKDHKTTGTESNRF